MSIVDERGRVFGAINLVDAAVVLFLAALLPVGYGAYLLFKPTQPTIESATAVNLGREELRVANGSVIAQKLKVRGTGFNPLLRAQVGDRPALAFVFENPNSADVLVGDIPAGEYDLVLFDGVQAVARANGVVKIHPSASTAVHTVGRFIALTPQQAQTLKPGYKSGDVIRGGFEVVAIGAPRPAHDQIRFGASGMDIPSAASEWPAVLLVRCDGVGNACSVGGVSLVNGPPVSVGLDGGVRFEIDELLPTTPPVRALLQVRFTGPQVALVQVGDRDTLLDSRAAVVTAIGARDANSATATLELGVDSSSGGWSYRGQLVRPGSKIRIVTDRYEAEGIISRADVAVAAKP
jgi:hypothetical protein